MRDSSRPRPLLLLDVDGVLNPDFSSRERSRAVYHDGWVQRKAWVNGTQYRVCVNPVHGTWLRELADDTGIELAWGSTWQEHANRCISPLAGLPRLPFVTGCVPGRKARAVVNWAAGRPFSWLDDDRDELLTANAITGTSGQEFLPVFVDERRGLTEAHLDSVRDWLATL
jgi:hypothetical protein